MSRQNRNNPDLLNASRRASRLQLRQVGEAGIETTRQLTHEVLTR